MKKPKPQSEGILIFMLFSCYCPIRGLGEKPSPLGEDFSMLAVWSTTANPAIPYTISNIT